jgi:hypothetical protein
LTELQSKAELSANRPVPQWEKCPRRLVRAAQAVRFSSIMTPAPIRASGHRSGINQLDQPDGDQNHRPIVEPVVDADNVQIAEQKQRANPHQNRTRYQGVQISAVAAAGAVFPRLAWVVVWFHAPTVRPRRRGIPPFSANTRALPASGAIRDRQGLP